MKSNKNSIYFFRVSTDIIILIISFFISAVYAQSLTILLSRPYMFAQLMIGLLLWIISSRSTHLNLNYLERSFPSNLFNLMNNILLQAIVSIVFIFITREDLFTRNFIVYYTLSLLGLVTVKNLLIDFYLKHFLKADNFLKNVLIVGKTELGINFKNEVIEKNTFVYNFIGFIDDKEDCIAKLSDLENFLLSNQIDEVIIALNIDNYSKIKKTLLLCDRLAVKSFLIPNYFGLLSNRFKLDNVNNFPIISVRNNPLEEFHWRLLKRAFDFTVSFLLFLFILWWLIPIIGIIIKISSKGPMFFIQDRIGRENKYFKCLKFRTMTVEASNEKYSGIPVTKNDNRISNIGRVLRASNLDELPQLLNVLRGNMSLVGPRPHAIAFDKDYGEIVDEIRLRHRVLPGITGWAQIHGLRGDVYDFEEQAKRTKKRIEYDIWYIENWSLKLDIQIIFTTIWQIISGKNKGI